MYSSYGSESFITTACIKQSLEDGLIRPCQKVDWCLVKWRFHVESILWSLHSCSRIMIDKWMTITTIIIKMSLIFHKDSNQLRTDKDCSNYTVRRINFKKIQICKTQNKWLVWPTWHMLYLRSHSSDYNKYNPLGCNTV